MSTPLPDPPPGFDELSEQIDYLQSLWDRVAAAAEEVPVPTWHSEIIRKRRADLESDPGTSVPWDQAKKEITSLLNEK